MGKKYYIIVLLGFFWTTLLTAQDHQPTLEERVMQLTLIHPLGTNGVDAPTTANNLSLNVVLGVSGRLHGAELGGFGNIVLQDAQFLQGAGFFNFVGGHFTGAQGAGFLNIVDESMNGIQGAGFLNIAGNPVQGVQGAGFMNVASRDLLGLQGAGFLNLASGDVRGAQGAGFINIAGEDVSGLQMAGFINIGGAVHGMQLAGFMNVARQLHGLTLAPINIIDSVRSGVPIGALSIVKKGGYFRGALWAGETMTTTLAIKTGLTRFYNIFGLGMHLHGNATIYGPMYGVGARIGLGDNWKLHLEGHHYQLLEELGTWDRFHALERFQVAFEWLWTERLGLTGGIAWNAFLEDNREPLPTIAPVELLPVTRGNFDVIMWPGAHLGIIF